MDGAGEGHAEDRERLERERAICQDATKLLLGAINTLGALDEKPEGFEEFEAFVYRVRRRSDRLKHILSAEESE